MADRILSEYTDADGDRIRIDRSAAGQPGIVIEATNTDGEIVVVIVEDAERFLAPVGRWLSQR